MATRQITPNDVAIQGNPDGTLKTLIVTNHWANDLVMTYAKVARDAYCRQEVAIDIIDNCPAGLGVIDSIARTISSLDFNIVPSEESEFLYGLARRSKNELLMALGRVDGYDGLVSAFCYDLLVKPFGFFGQYTPDGNGRPSAIGTINCRTPRPYYEQVKETFNDLTPTKAGKMLVTPTVREVMNVAGIWWVDGDRSYSLPKTHYKQSVDGARGSGAFLVGRSTVEKNRLRLWLSATLEEYIQRVTSGTDESGMLIMNNLSWKMLLKQIKARKLARKQPEMNDEDAGGFLYVANVGKEEGKAKWISFRQFPEGLDFLEFWRMANDMVASSFGVKSWRIDSGGGADSGGKFGNAKRAVQLDAQEPTVQWVMSRFQSFINNIYFFGIPMQFQWVGGSSAADSTKIDNQARIAQTVTQATYMSEDEQRRFAIFLGAPRGVFDNEMPISSSSEGIVRRTSEPTDIAKSIIAESISALPFAIDRYGVDPERALDVTDGFHEAVDTAIDMVLRKALGHRRYTNDGMLFATKIKGHASSLCDDLGRKALVLANEPVGANVKASLEIVSAEIYGECSRMIDRVWQEATR